MDFRPHGIILGVDLFMSDSTNHSYFDQNQNAGRPCHFPTGSCRKEGKLFTMYKFRSMQVIHSGSSISIAGESRITPLGAVLRKYKLDELPELWNVLIGDMSFVGPRPDVPGYADQLTGENKLILKLRPGITGPASLKYANEEELLAQVPDPVKYNNEIIFRTKFKSISTTIIPTLFEEI